MSAPGNPEAIGGRGRLFVRVFFPSVSPSPISGASNGFGISTVHFLECVNYLVGAHICQQAEGRPRCVPTGQAARGPGRCPLPAPWRLPPAHGVLDDGDLALPAGAVPRLSLLAWPLLSEPWVPPLEGS